jgi:hypothetical protein
MLRSVVAVLWVGVVEVAGEQQIPFGNDNKSKSRFPSGMTTKATADSLQE